MGKEERNMDKLLISFLLSLFMVYFPLRTWFCLPSLKQALTAMCLCLHIRRKHNRQKHRRRAACTLLS